MFGKNPCSRIFNRHEPASKVSHLGIEGQMLIVEG
jgi:hypothetical protein